MDFLEKFKNNKWLVLILIIGVIILWAGSWGTGEPKKETKVNYEDELEVRMESLISSIDGAGKVKVMLTLENEGRTIPATDVKTNQAGQEVKNLIISGTGLAVVEETKPKVLGVVVVAQGGNKQTVKAEIVAAVSALVEAPPHKIQVLKMREE